MSFPESSSVFTLPENTLPQRLQSYRQRKELTDITVRVGNKKLAAHRIVLKDSALEGWITKKWLWGQYECKLDERSVSSEIVEDLLDFLYTASITLTTENTRSLTIAAKHLKMTPLLEACEKFLSDSVSPPNVIVILLFSDKHQLNSLRQCCAHCLNEHCETVFTDAKPFNDLSPEEMETVVKTINTEQCDQKAKEAVVERVVEWTEMNPAQRVKGLESALKHVQLNELSKQFLVDVLAKQKVIKESPTCDELVNETIAKVFPPQTEQERENLSSEQEGFSNNKLTEKLRDIRVNDSEEETDEQILKTGESVEIDWKIELEDEVNKSTNLKNINETDDHDNPIKNPRSLKDLGKCRVYCFGGNYEKKTVSCMNVSTGEWQKVANMTCYKWWFSGAAIGSKVYLCGGSYTNEMEVFDCSTHTWTQLTPMPQNRYNCAAAVLNGYVYVTGGRTETSDSSELLSSVIRYNIQTDQWETVKPMNYERNGHQLVELNNCLYAIGDQKGIKKAEKYNTSTDHWTEIAETNYNHFWSGAISHGGKIYACGKKGFEVYSPEPNSWKKLSPLEDYDDHSGRTLVSLNDELLAIGGYKNEDRIASVFSYDPTTDQWTQLPDMDTPRDLHCSFVINL